MSPHPRRGEIVSHADVFALDLHRALLEQLPEALEALTPVPLAPLNLEVLGGERGVYQLFEKGQSVYVGKSEHHRRRCSGRLHIDVRDMSFRCLYVDRFVDAASPERVLIEEYKARGLAPWNSDEGFAPRDVGRKRDMGRPGQWFLDRPADYRALIRVDAGGRPSLSCPLFRPLRGLSLLTCFAMPLTVAGTERMSRTRSATILTVRYRCLLGLHRS